MCQRMTYCSLRTLDHLWTLEVHSRKPALLHETPEKKSEGQSCAPKSEQLFLMPPATLCPHLIQAPGQIWIRDRCHQFLEGLVYYVPTVSTHVPLWAKSRFLNFFQMPAYEYIFGSQVKGLRLFTDRVGKTDWFWPSHYPCEQQSPSGTWWEKGTSKKQKITHPLATSATVI